MSGFDDDDDYADDDDDDEDEDEDEEDEDEDDDDDNNNHYVRYLYFTTHKRSWDRAPFVKSSASMCWAHFHFSLNRWKNSMCIFRKMLLSQMPHGFQKSHNITGGNCGWTSDMQDEIGRNTLPTTTMLQWNKL